MIGPILSKYLPSITVIYVIDVLHIFDALSSILQEMSEGNCQYQQFMQATQANKGVYEEITPYQIQTQIQTPDLTRSSDPIKAAPVWDAQVEKESKQEYFVDQQGQRRSVFLPKFSFADTRKQSKHENSLSTILEMEPTEPLMDSPPEWSRNLASSDAIGKHSELRQSLKMELPMSEIERPAPLYQAWTELEPSPTKETKPKSNTGSNDDIIDIPESPCSSVRRIPLHQSLSQSSFPSAAI